MKTYLVIRLTSLKGCLDKIGIVLFLVRWSFDTIIYSTLIQIILILSCATLFHLFTNPKEVIAIEILQIDASSWL